MSEPIVTPDTADIDLSPTDRRALLRKLAIGGAGAAAGAVLLGNGTASAGDQAAAPAIAGNAVELGLTNTAVDPTIIDYTPAATPTEGPSAFSAGGYVPPATSPFPAGVGGYGDESIPHGVHGSTTAPAGFGIVAANLAPPAATATDPVPTGLAVASAGGAQIRFVPLPDAVTGPTPGKHVAGELYVDKDGTLWFTVPVPPATDAEALDSGTVRFVKLAGIPTAGAFHAIAPQRSYDSRQPNYAEKGLMAPNSTRVISVADGHSANGTVNAPNVVPAGATAVQINVTAANMTGPNFLSVTAGDTTSTETSLLNWGAGAIQIANSITVPIDAERKIKVFCGGQTGSTEVIIDVFGYSL